MQEVFPDILDAIDAGLNGTAPMPDEGALLEMGERILVAWLAARDAEPDGREVEGFRLLALHRQGCKGEPTFNACRETCREIVFRHNCVVGYSDDTEKARQELRLMAMTVKHLALFVGGKLTEAGLGDFCCSSRPLHQAAGAA